MLGVLAVVFQPPTSFQLVAYSLIFLLGIVRRPAQQCTCERAAEENTVTGDSCECGLRKAEACECYP